VKIRFVNCQRRDPVPAVWLARVANRAARRMKIRGHGTMAVSFVDSATMRRLNRRFTGHRGLTDVLSFNYMMGKPASPAGGMMGEILVAPAFARAYAAKHALPYREELARYVIHGLLHWLGHDDATPAEQRRMRKLEDGLLASKGGTSRAGKGSDPS